LTSKPAIRSDRFKPQLRMKLKSILIVAAVVAGTLFVLNKFLPANLAVELGLNGKA
jgi:hypothetical protein